MEEAGNHPLFVEPGALGKIQHVDAVELVILAPVDQPRDGIGNRGSAVCFNIDLGLIPLMPLDYMGAERPCNARSLFGLIESEPRLSLCFYVFLASRRPLRSKRFASGAYTTSASDRVAS